MVGGQPVPARPLLVRPQQGPRQCPCRLLRRSLKKEPRKVVLELAKFLNADAAARLETERGLLERLLEQTTRRRRCFRKGVVGDWRSFFNRDQERRFREAYDLALAGTEMHDLWAEYVAPST
ncbi:hypothetical protein MRX96_011160 [Rhipicephalus microplus]